MSGNTDFTAAAANIIIPASNKSIQESTWQGSLPILLSLATASLSSPSTPRPIHKMVSRVSYLHLALHEEVMQLAAYAPAALSSATTNIHMSVEEPPDDSSAAASAESSDENKVESSSVGKSNDEKEQTTPNPLQHYTTKSRNHQYDTKDNTTKYPECWFEDEESGTPLRWHLFAGILYDLMKCKSVLKCNNNNTSTSNTQPTEHCYLPWRLRIHFTAYPTDQILPLNDGCNPQPDISNDGSGNSSNSHHEQISTLFRSIFRNSLKQALFMQYNSSKVAMSITKNFHEKLWEALLQSNYAIYHEVVPGCSSSSMMQPTKDDDNGSNIPQLIPIRIMLNDNPVTLKPIKHEKESKNDECKKRPAEILEKLGTSQAPPYTTLGGVMAKCLPDHFVIDESTGWATAVLGSTLQYSIQGVRPSLKCVMVDLWRALSHPDLFLYICIVSE